MIFIIRRRLAGNTKLSCSLTLTIATIITITYKTSLCAEGPMAIGAGKLGAGSWGVVWGTRKDKRTVQNVAGDGNVGRLGAWKGGCPSSLAVSKEQRSWLCFSTLLLSTQHHYVPFITSSASSIFLFNFLVFFNSTSYFALASIMRRLIGFYVNKESKLEMREYRNIRTCHQLIHGVQEKELFPSENNIIKHT